MDFSIGISRENLKEVKDFLETDLLFDAMNIYGLEFESMALLLQAVIDRVEEIEKELGDDDGDE